MTRTYSRSSTLCLALLALLLPVPGETQEPPGHSAFTALLAEVVHVPRVDYGSLVAKRSELEAYLRSLANTDPAVLDDGSREVRLAFWINAYNACMLRRVADHYPIRKGAGLLGAIRNALADRPENSVWQIKDVFTAPFCPVAGRARSLDEIEHEIIRPIGDPRIHFVVNCAARSCPPLMPEAYVPDRLDEQLDQAVRRFVADPAHFHLESGPDPVLTLNKVLDWYGGDFGGEAGLVAFLADYVPEASRQTLLMPGLSVRFFEYDWTLNDVEP